MITAIQTNSGITFLLNYVPYSVSSEHLDYPEIVEAIHRDEPEDYILEILNRKTVALNTAIAVSDTLTVENGEVRYCGEPLHNYAATKLVELINAGAPVTALTNFIAKLLKNPSHRVVESLYEFLEYGQIPLTEDGNFVAYKAIKGDWKDIYTGRIDNSIGTTVFMPRNKVNENPDQTCSSGLHVCSFSYLPHFAQVNGGRIVAVEVNPEDVVAIPRDYNNTKMRTCKYTVLSELTQDYNRGQNVLSQAPVFGGDAYYDYNNSEFRVRTRGYDLNEDYVEDDKIYDNLDVARVKALEYKRDGNPFDGEEVFSSWVVDEDGDTIYVAP